MRILTCSLLALFVPLSARAATLKVDVARNGFAAPMEIMVASRVEGRLPEWSSSKTLPAGARSVTFPDVAPGMYIVLARGPEPLQRLSARVNVGASGAVLDLRLRKSKVIVCATLAGQPLGRAAVSLTHDELRWPTQFETDREGCFAGTLWEPAVYTASVRRDVNAAPHVVRLHLSAARLNIDVPDRHVAGRVLGEEGMPLTGAIVVLRSETGESTLSARTRSAADGRFEFFGVPEGTHSLSARAPSYVDTHAALFDLRGTPGRHAVDLRMRRGSPREIRVVDARDGPIASATLLAACDGHVTSTSLTGADGRASIALPDSASCVVLALPREGSIAIARVVAGWNGVVRVPAASSSLRLALKSESGEVFPSLRLLARIDGITIPPAVARQLGGRGLTFVTDDEGILSLARIPAGTYEFWPYRTEAEGEMLYEGAAYAAAPISLNVVTGENHATVRFKARR